MVRAGEASGALAPIFERLSEFERTRDDLRSYIISSMIYPALLATVGLASVLMLLNFVVPRFATIFAGFAHEDPAADADHAGGQLHRADVLVDGGAVGWRALLIGWRAYIEHAGGAPLVGRRSGCSIPLLGDALRKAETARFARAMATLVANTVPLVQSIGIAAAILNNRTHLGRAGGRGAGRQARRGHRRPRCARRACFRRWPRTC